MSGGTFHGVKTLACLAALLCGGHAAAQVTQVQPPNPTSVDIVRLTIAAPLNAMRLQPIVVAGSEIRVTFRGGSDAPFGEVHDVTLGPLPPGTYSVIVTFEFTDGGEPETVVSTLTLPPLAIHVSAGYFVPAVEPRSLLALVAALAFVAIVVLRR